MATKTVVCPECGVPAAPGRYACAECGALLAAVGGLPRTWPTMQPAVEPMIEPTVEPMVANPPPTAAPLSPATAEASPVVDPPANGTKSSSRRPRIRRASPVEAPVETPIAATTKAAPAPAAAPAPVPAPAAPEPSWPVDPVAPVVRRRLSASPLPVAPPSTVVPDEADAPFEPATQDEEEIEARRASLAPLSASLSPSWPPPGDRGPAPLPIERTPAGAYLAPSAVLPPLDAPAIAQNGSQPTSSGAPAAQPERAKEPRGPRPSLTERLDAFGITEETPRRVAGASAAIAALGFVLPWRSSPFGGDLIDGYISHWGLAGPGNWLVVGLLLGLASLGLTRGRLARLPVGLPGVALATLLVGLLWPSLFSAGAKPVGIWVVLAGAILLATAGVLAARRHEVSEPPV
jgi:hypothetical protein